MTTFTTEDRMNALGHEGMNDEPIPFAGWVAYSRNEVLEDTVRQLMADNERLKNLVDSLTIDLAFYKGELNWQQENQKP